MLNLNFNHVKITLLLLAKCRKKKNQNLVHLNLYSRFAQVHNKIKIKIDKQDLYFRYKPSYTEGVQTSETDFTIYG